MAQIILFCFVFGGEKKEAPTFDPGGGGSPRKANTVSSSLASKKVS